MSSLWMIMIHITGCLQELLPFVHENSPFLCRPVFKSSNYDRSFMKVGHDVFTIMSSTSLIMVYITPCLHELFSFVHENSPGLFNHNFMKLGHKFYTKCLTRVL